MENDAPRCLRFIDVVIRETPSYCGQRAAAERGERERSFPQVDRQRGAAGGEERRRTGTRCIRRTSKRILRGERGAA